MDGKRLIEKIKLRNILSFGDKGEEIELEPLNIIIGQNASGKSNFIDVIKLLRSLPQDKGLATFISKNGGISEWIWKGRGKKDFTQIELIIDGIIKSQYLDNPPPLLYKISFAEINFKVSVIGENLQEESKRFEDSEHEINYFSSFNGLYEVSPQRDLRRNLSGKLPLGESVFSQVKDFANFYEVSTLGMILADFKIYSDINTNRSSDLRTPKSPDILDDFLEEDGTNLLHILNYLKKDETESKIIENLKKFYPNTKSYEVRDVGEYLQFYFIEENLSNAISARRLSDGTLRYLCLLAILCHPKPPPLICIEEPETGLHPDILPTIASLMKEASQRTQLIVTTHSDILVSAFSDMPEAVLVCEKDEDGTHFKRLEADKLKVWLDEYSLGEAWLRGAIGGTRW